MPEDKSGRDKCGGSYIHSEDWIEKKKATVHPKKKDDKCFQYATAVALNYGEIESHPERVSNIILFIKKHIWDGTKYSSKIDVWKCLRKIIQQSFISGRPIFQKLNWIVKNK